MPYFRPRAPPGRPAAERGHSRLTLFFICREGHQKPLGESQREVVALAMTWVAGVVDAVGYLTLDHLYTANMSGNTVRLGFRGAERNWMDAIRGGWPVLMFVAGLIVSAILIEFAKRTALRSRFAMPLALETAVLATFILLGDAWVHGGQIRPSAGGAFYFLVALPAIGMGLQNATLTSVGALNFHTTHVTGTLTSFAEKASEYFFWAFDRVRTGGAGEALRESGQNRDFRSMLFLAFQWLAFAIGAVCGGFLRDREGLMSLAPATFLVAVLACVDVIRPIAPRPGPR